jgi:flagellar M-ring protein FliF
MAGYKDTVGQAKRFWQSRTLQQKGLLVGGAAATLLLMALLVWFIDAPDYKTLYTGLDPSDAQTLGAQLDAQQIPHQTSPDGKTISVPADKLDAARLQTAAQGAPHSGHMGFELFDKMTWGQTEFDEKVTYQRGLEGELERTIETLNGVESARVHLVMPTDSVFLDRQREAKASVILKLSRNGISPDAVHAIAGLAAGAVDELKPENVSIINADTDESLNGNHDTPGNNAGAEMALTQKLISTIEPIVGTDKIRASVNMEYDEGSTEESQEKYDPTGGVVLNTQKTEDNAGAGAAQSGIPGTASNVPAANLPEAKQNKTATPGKTATPAANPAPALNPTQTSKTETTQYGVNRVVTHKMEPAGRIRRVTAAILVDDSVAKVVTKGKVTYTRVKRSPQELAQIQALAEAVIGFDSSRGDSIKVENVSFENALAGNDLEEPGWNQKLEKASMGALPILRPVCLLALFVLAYLLVLRPMKNQVLASVPAMSTQPELAAARPEELLIAGLHVQPEANRKLARLREETAALIQDKSTNTAHAVQAWLREES